MENIMRRIQSLLERAAHPATSEHERLASQDMAEKLMAKYRLDRAMLNFNKKKGERREPISREYALIKLVNRETASNRRDYIEEYGIENVIDSLRYSIFFHAKCKTTQMGGVFTAVGYEEDIFFAEVLWNTIFQDIVTKMFPTWRDDLSFEENVFTLKNAGFSWPQVREMGIAHSARDRSGPLTEKNAAHKLRAAYQRNCNRVGFVPPKEQPRNPGLWRRSFVDSYDSRIRQRLLKMRQENEGFVSKEGEVALAQDQNLVTDMFYEMFPNLDPKNFPPMDLNDDRVKSAIRTKKFKHKTRNADPTAWDAGFRAADQVNLHQHKAAGDTKEALPE